MSNKCLRAHVSVQRVQQSVKVGLFLVFWHFFIMIHFLLLNFAARSRNRCMFESCQRVKGEKLCPQWSCWIQIHTFIFRKQRFLILIVQFQIRKTFVDHFEFPASVQEISFDYWSDPEQWRKIVSWYQHRRENYIGCCSFLSFSVVAALLFS